MKSLLNKIAVVVAAFMLAACAPEQSHEQINDSLSLAVSASEWEEMLSAVATYKQLYPEVNLEITHIEASTSEEQYKKLSAEVMSGGGPDLLLINDMLFPDPEKSMQAGVFADLTAFLKADETYNSDDYYQPVLAAGGDAAGQYIFPLSFTFPAIAGDKQVLQQHNIDFAAPLSAHDLLKNMSGYLESGGTIPLLPDQMKNGMLNPFDMLDVHRLDFDDANFLEMMQWYKALYQTGNVTYKANGFHTTSTRMHEPLGTKYLLCNGDLWYNDFVPIYNLLAAVNSYSEPFFYPIYGADGKINAQITSGIAINNASRNKQNAYNFVRIARDLPGDDAAKMSGGFGIKRTDLGELFAANEARVSGGTIDADVAVEPLGEAQLAQLSSFMEDIGSCTFQTGISAALYERFLPYFAGEVELASCIAEAQNWLEIYTTE